MGGEIFMEKVSLFYQAHPLDRHDIAGQQLVDISTRGDLTAPRVAAIPSHAMRSRGEVFVLQGCHEPAVESEDM